MIFVKKWVNRNSQYCKISTEGATISTKYTMTLIIAGLFAAILVSGCIAPLISQTETPANSSLQFVSSWENGDRYLAGNYTVVVLNGTYREMGQQYGGLMKDELLAEYAMITTELQARGYTIDEIRSLVRDNEPFLPERVKEIYRGIAEVTGLTEDDAYVLYYGPILYLTTPYACSYLAVWDEYTVNGSVVVSRNWDTSDELKPFNPYYVLAVYNPTDGSNSVATFSQAAAAPETLMNSKGLYISDDASGQGISAPENLQEILAAFFGLMLDFSDLDGLDAGIRALRPSGTVIIDAAGPTGAYVYEVGLVETKQRTGDGVIAASNHFVDPFWTGIVPEPNSVIRYDNLLRQSEEAKGTIDGEKMVEIRDVAYEDGGATFTHTVFDGIPCSSNHQIIFVPADETLWIKVVDCEWAEVELAPLFTE